MENKGKHYLAMLVNESLESEDQTTRFNAEQAERQLKNISLTPEFINNIDWKLLREQKEILLGALKYFKKSSTLESAFDGVINLLDSLQDYAADKMELGEKVVFGTDEETE